MLSSFMGRRDTEEIQREEEEESFQLYSGAGGSLHPECPGTVRPFMRGCWKKEDWTENTRAETSKINREEGSSKSENTFFATVPQKSSRLISRDSLIVNTRIKRSIIVLARGSVYIRRRDRELHFAENIFLFLLLLFFFFLLQQVRIATVPIVVIYASRRFISFLALFQLHRTTVGN